jgi:hypothetical protein
MSCSLSINHPDDDCCDENFRNSGDSCPHTPPPVNPLTLEIYDIVDIDDVYQIGEILAIPKTDSAKQRHDQRR